MKAAVIGGGPAGLFFALLLKKADPGHEIQIYERNRLEDTFGFGVVFSDATEEALAHGDREVTEEMAAKSHRWDDIEVHYRGMTLTSTGHRFSGLSRKTLLAILADRCRAAGVRICHEREIRDPEEVRSGADLVLAADGANSMVRERYKEHFRPSVDVRPNRFVWFGTTKPFPAFTFYFKPSPHGLWRVHAYQYEPGASTFIVEAREETWRAAGLDRADEAATIQFCERLLAELKDRARGLPVESIDGDICDADMVNAVFESLSDALRRGERIEQNLTVKIPADLPKGEHRILLSDAVTLNRLQSAAVSSNRYLDLPETVSLLNQERGNNRLYVSVVQRRPTYYTEDKTLPALPLSVLNVLQTQRSAGRALTGIAESAEEELSIPFDQMVTGSFSRISSVTGFCTRNDSPRSPLAAAAWIGDSGGTYQTIGSVRYSGCSGNATFQSTAIL
jgi:hypothetical protein